MVLTIGSWQFYKGDTVLDSPRLRVFSGIISHIGMARGTPFVNLQRAEINNINSEKDTYTYFLDQSRRAVSSFALPRSPEFPGRPTSTLAKVITDNRSTHLQEGLPMIVGAVLEAIGDWEAKQTPLGRTRFVCRVVGPGPVLYTAPGYQFKELRIV